MIQRGASGVQPAKHVILKEAFLGKDRVKSELTSGLSFLQKSCASLVTSEFERRSQTKAGEAKGKTYGISIEGHL
jgi:hypothetical protein